MSHHFCYVIVVAFFSWSHKFFNLFYRAYFCACWSFSCSYSSCFPLCFFSLLFTRARSLTQFCKVPVWPDSSCYCLFLNQEDTRGDKLPQHPPPHLLWGEEKGTVLPFPETRRNQELLPAQGLARGWGLWLHSIWSMGPNLLFPYCQLPVSSQ
jgi:hypothetical protein